MEFYQTLVGGVVITFWRSWVQGQGRWKVRCEKLPELISHEQLDQILQEFFCLLKVMSQGLSRYKVKYLSELLSHIDTWASKSV